MPQGPSHLHRIAIATLSFLAAANPSIGFASKFTDCKNQALARYNTAVVEADPENAKRAIIDDIVRYLRQQDDVVVLQEDGGYLVNGRFRMTASELVARANRMRTRQRKPAFEVANGALPSGASAAKSHPLFWEQPPANEPLVTNGFHKPE